MDLTFEQLIALLTFFGAGVGAAFALVQKVLVPAWLRRQEEQGRHAQELEERRLEHEQELEEMQAKTDDLERLSAMQNRAYQDEQMTIFTSEALTQLGLANEYVRRENSDKLDILIQKMDQLMELWGRVASALERNLENK